MFSEVKTNGSGTAGIKKPLLWDFSLKRNFDYTISLKVIQSSDNPSFTVYNFPYKTRDKNHNTKKLMINEFPANLDISGREIKLVNLSNKIVNVRVPVAELHKIDSIQAALTIQPNFTNTITTLFKTETWNVSGTSIIKSSDTTISINSDHITESCEILTAFQFIYQEWELQCFINDKWTQIMNWEELLPYKLIGGAYQGKSVSGDNFLHSPVINGNHGDTFELSKDFATRIGYGEISFNSGFTVGNNHSFIGDNIIGENIVDYNPGGIKLMTKSINNRIVIAYDNNTNQSIWYYTNKK